MDSDLEILEKSKNNSVSKKEVAAASYRIHKYYYSVFRETFMDPRDVIEDDYIPVSKIPKVK